MIATTSKLVIFGGVNKNYCEAATFELEIDNERVRQFIKSRRTILGM